MITERLKSALKNEDEQKITGQDTVLVAELTSNEPKIETTQEELEGFMIVKTILRQKISISRIFHRDAQSYFAILLDDNNRKTICRLYLNGQKKYIGTIDSQRGKKSKTKLRHLTTFLTLPIYF